MTFYLNQDSSTLDFDKNVVASDDNSVTFVQTIVVNKVDVEATVPNISYQVGMDNPIGPNYDLKVGSEYLINARVSSGSNYYNGEANAKNKTNPISYKKISDIKTPGDYYRELTFELGDKYDGLEVSNYNFQSVNGIAPVISSDGKELTYMQEINVTKSPLVAESIETIKVTMGDSTPIFGDNDSLTIGKNEVASSDQLEYGFKYYDTAQDALDSYTGKEVPESKYVSGNGYSPVFLKSQTYFRTITFKVFGSVDSYTFNGTEGTDYVLGEDGVKGRLITFAQPIVVTGPTVTAQIPPLTLTYGSVQYSDVTNTGELSLVDSTTGKSIGTTAGKNEFYASAEDAYENEIGYLDYNDLNADTTYYRRITFNVSKPGDLTNHDYTNDYDFTNEKINGYYAIIGRNTVSYIQEVHVNPVSTTLKVDYQPVKLGTALVRGIPIGYLMNNNENLQNSDIIPKYAFYNSAEDALKESNPILNQKPDPASEADLTIFTKARDYYYPLTFTVSNVNNYKLSGTEGVNYVVDSTNNTITYAVKVTVSKSATTATVPDITIGVGVPISTIDNDFDGISIISNDTGKPIPSSDQIGAYPRIISSELTPRYYDTNEISADNIGTLTPFEGSAFTKPGTYYRLVGLYNSDVPNYSFDDLINGSTGMTQSDGEGNEIVLYIQKVNVVANPVSEKIDTVSASVGSAVTSAPSGDNDLTANDESIVDTSKTSTGGEYFASASDAVSNNNSLGTTFKNNGKVYRRITFTLNNPISDYSFEGIAGSDYVVDTNSNTVTFAQPVIVNTSTVVPNISTETVQNGSLISSSENGNNDLMVNNQSIVADNGISYGTDYYDSSDKIADVLSGQVQPVSSVTDGTNFTNAGSYYRIIKFSLKDGLDASGYAFGNGKVDGNTVEYVQKVNVKANSTLVEVPRVITNTGALTTSFDEQADYGLTSAGGSIVSADGIQFGNYYDDVKSALSPATATPSAGVDQVNHKFLKNQTFYRTVTFTLKSDTSNYDFSNLPAGSYSLSGNKITLAQEINVEDNPASVDIFDAQGSLNGLVINSEQADKNNLYVTDDSGNKTPIYQSISFDSNYYSKDDLSADSAVNITSSDGKFTKAGTYYREIIFHLKDGVGDVTDFNGTDVKNIDKTNNTVSFVQKVNVTPNTTTVNVKNLNVNVGDSTNISDTAGDGLIDSDNNSLVENNGISFDTNYYSSAADALKGDTSKAVNVGTNFTTAGETYYRRITFKLKDDANNYTFTDLVNGVGSTKDGNSITFVQAITVNKSTVTSDISPLQAIKVGSTTGDVKETSTDQLFDQNDNSIIANGGKKVGTDYYDSAAAALSSVTESDTAKSLGVKDNKFTKPQTYYRTITFTLKNPVDQYSFAGKAGEDYVIGADNKTITYVQSVTASANPTTATIPDINVNVGTEVSSIDNNVDGIELIDNSTTSTLINKITADTVIYNSVNDALMGNTSKKVMETSFPSAGQTYYRRVTITLNDDAANHDFTDMVNDVEPIISKDGTTITYIQQINVEVSAVNEKIANVTGKVGDKVSDVTLGTNDLTINNGKGSIMTNGGIKTGDEYYSSPEDAIENVSALGDTLNKPGTYYRTITFELNNPASSYTFNGTEGTDYSVDGNEVTFAQKITVGSISATASVDPINVSAKTKVSVIAGDQDYTLTGAEFDHVVTTYYKSLKGALNQDSSDVDSGAVSGDYLNEGNYYRLIYFNLDSDFAKDYVVSDDNVKVIDEHVAVYAQPVNVKNKAASKYNVSVGKANVGDNKVSDTASENELYDQNGQKISDVTVSYGSKYYDRASDVFESGIKTTSNVDSEGNFTKADTYYREIIFHLTSAELDANNFGPDAQVDMKNKTVSFVQAVVVGANTITVTVDPLTVNVGTSINADNVTNTDSFKLTDSAGKSLGTATVDNTFYSSVDGALNKNTTAITTGAIDGAFVKGTFYRVITFKTDNPDFAKDYVLNNPNVRINEDGSISFAQQINVQNSSLATPNIAVARTTTGNGDGLNDKSGNQLFDQAGKNIAQDVTFGTDYFTNYNDVFKGTKPGKFTTAGTYYRAITFRVNPADINNNTFGTDAHLGKDTVSYVQTVVVEPDQEQINVSNLDLNVAVNTKDNPALTSTDNYTLTNSKGSLVDPTKGIVLGKQYFTDKDLTKPAKDASGVRILKAGNYFRTVKFYLVANAGSADDFDKIGGKYNLADNSVTFVQKIKATTSSAIYKINNATVESDVLTTDSELNNPEDIYIVGKDGHTIVADGGISFDSNIYSTKSDAENQSNPNKDVDKNNKFTRTGSYYQRVTVSLVDNGVNAYDFGGDTAVDKDNNEVTFIRVITVNPASSTGGSTGGNSGSTTGGNSSSSGTGSGSSENESNDDWTYTPIKGVVTTESNYSEYTLNNQNNEEIVNRALIENTAWKTDQYRTNKKGVRQYRVATDEWIDASDVVFDQEVTDDWTYSSIKGVVTTKNNRDSYQLDSHTNNPINNRKLAKNSAWKTDLYRSNHEGVRQYRVATGEWIDVNDVVFSQGTADEDNWIYTNINGIITTKTAQETYALNNQANKIISKRSLAEDTSWKTDEYRTNKEGVRQYRVATGEWVDANYVFYEEPVATGVFKNASKVNGIINLDRTSTVYKLYSKENQLIEDYSLAKETSWKADYQAEDSDGSLYYHVGKDEWIKAVKGVHFNIYAWY